MPITPTFPGVYVEEIPSGVHTITGVATSIAAFIDVFERGPLDYAVHLLSMSDFERYMGGLDITSEASYAIQQFFMNGGTECYAVRVAKGAGVASKAIQDSAAATVFTATAGQIINNQKVDNPGAWGNGIRVEVDYDTSDPTKLFNLTISEVDPTTNNVLQSEIFRNLNTTAGDPAYALDVVNNASRIVYLTVGASVNRPEATGTTGGSLPVPPPGPAPVVADLVTCTVTPSIGSPATCTLKLGGAKPADYPSLRPFLEAAIRASDPNNPLIAGATVQLSGGGTLANPYFFRVLAGRGSNFNPGATLTFSDTGGTDVLATDVLLKTATVNVQQIELLGGTPGAAIDQASIRGQSTVPKKGLYALDDVDLFNILCIPTAANLDPTSMGLVITEALTYCTARRAMFIVDVPSTVTDILTMQTWMSQNDSLRSINSAVYFPRLRIPDPLKGARLRDVGPSGTLAGLWAATDVSRGVWKAPAGVDVKLVNVPQLVYNAVDRENGVLNPLGINCLRNFPIYGNISWGARTLFGADVQASEWKYIPIRRLALFLEESLFRGTKWVVFEPNDEPLWAQIRMNVTSFMHDLFRQGAFQGSSPDQAYLVKCDSEINTQFEIDRGIVNILVGFAPLKPAEFVILQIQQLAGQTPA